MRRALDARPTWLPDPSACPTPLGTLSDLTGAEDEAKGGRLGPMVSRCQAGDTGACMAAAHSLQSESKTSSAAQSLFLRGCARGSASGCTNAAAARTPADRCAIDAFAAACERAHDPWGCSMLACHLAEGTGVARDLERARAVADRLCADVPGSSPCDAARWTIARAEAVEMGPSR